jgi:hypothetical protein
MAKAGAKPPTAIAIALASNVKSIFFAFLQNNLIRLLLFV